MNRLMSPVVLKCLSGRLSNTVEKPGRRPEQPCHHRDAVGAIPAHSGNILKPCAMQTPGMPRCKAGRAPMKNGSAMVRTGGDRD